MSAPKFVHVELPGHGTFWVEEAVLRGAYDSPVIPEEHITDGRLNTFRGDLSYAHAYPDERGILRFHRKIADVSDLKVLDA